MNKLYDEFMITRRIFFLWFYLFLHSLYATPLAEQFKQAGYVEICDEKDGTTTFDSLYIYFDEFIELLQTNPVWAKKLHTAKERFIRSKDRNYYSTDFFGLYDDSKREGRNQIAFYYSIHFHKFICSRYPEYETDHSPPWLTHFMGLKNRPLESRCDQGATLQPESKNGWLLVLRAKGTTNE